MLKSFPEVVKYYALAQLSARKIWLSHAEGIRYFIPIYGKIGARQGELSFDMPNRAISADYQPKMTLLQDKRYTSIRLTAALPEGAVRMPNELTGEECFFVPAYVPLVGRISWVFSGKVQNRQRALALRCIYRGGSCAPAAAPQSFFEATTDITYWDVALYSAAQPRLLWGIVRLNPNGTLQDFLYHPLRFPSNLRAAAKKQAVMSLGRERD